MANEYELLPCPFCGMDGVLFQNVQTSWLGNQKLQKTEITYWAECSGRCCTKPAQFTNQNWAIDAWNRRANGK